MTGSKLKRVTIAALGRSVAIVLDVSLRYRFTAVKPSRRKPFSKREGSFAGISKCVQTTKYLNSLYVSVIASGARSSFPFLQHMRCRVRFRFAGITARSRQFCFVSQMISPIVLVLICSPLAADRKRFGGRRGLYGGSNIAFTVWMLQSYRCCLSRVKNLTQYA